MTPMITMTRIAILALFALFAASVSFAATTALAGISEPEHVFYGTVLDHGVPVSTGTMSVRINGAPTPMASFVLGSLPAFGTKYVLRIPMSSGTPRLANTAQEGDAAAFYLGTKLVGTGIVGEHGAAQRLDLDANFQGVPALSVADVTLAEGNSGTVNAVFSVSLDFPTISAITFHYETANGTATAPEDYAPASGTGTISAGDTSFTVSVPISGDGQPEASETFTLTISDPKNATIQRATATGTIVDDDTLPLLSIDDASANEGAVHTTLRFQVTMTSVSTAPVTVSYQLDSGTAAGGVDFDAEGGTLTIAPGALSAAIEVEILGDADAEADETFTIVLSDAAGATLTRATATGTIVDDDRILTFIEAQRNSAGLRGVRGLAISPRGEHLYAAASIDNAIVTFARDAILGRLTETQLVQNGAGGASGLGGVRSLALSPGGRHLYAAGTSDGALAVYARDPNTGLLTFVEVQKNGFSGASGLRGISDVAVAGDGLHVYAVSADESAIAAFSRNATTGRLTFVEARFQGIGGFDGLSGASSLAISSGAMRNVYVGSPGSSAVAVLQRNGTTGGLTMLEVQRNGAAGVTGLLGLLPVALSADEQQLYAGAPIDRALGVFGRSLSTGLLSFAGRFANALDGVEGLSGVARIAASPNGRFVFCAAAADDAVSVFSRDRVTGALTFRQVERTGVRGVSGLAGAAAAAVSPDSRFVYIAAPGDDAVVTFHINEAATRSDPNGDGALTIADVFYLINCFFADGPAPVEGGDFNGDSQTNVADVFYLINYFFAEGPL